MSYRKNLKGLLLTIIVAASFILAGCQTGSGTADKTAPTEPPKKSSVVGMSGEADESGRVDDQKSISLYKATVTQFPDDAASDVAWFRLGKHYLNLRKYRSALEHFEKITNSFPGSKFLASAEINRGICLVYLKQHEEADRQLRESFNKAAPEMQGSILYYLGENSYLSGDYMRALVRYGKTNESGGVFATSAKRRITMIVHSYLSEGQLMEVATSYEDKFPADIALMELARIYGRSGDTRSMEMVERRIARYFPDMRKQEEEAPGEAPVVTRSSSGITIGCVLPLSGPDAAIGAEALRGIQLAFSLRNHTVDRYSVGLLIKDSGSDPRMAAEGVRELARDSSVTAIVGPFSGGVASQSLRVADRYRIPLLTPLDSGSSAVSSSMFGGSAGGDYLFPIGITDRRSAEVMAAIAVERHGFKKIAAIYPDTDKGSQMISAFQQRTEKFGGEVISFQPYFPDAIDFGEQLKALGGARDSDVRKIIWAKAENDENAKPEEINALLEEEFMEALTIPYISKYRELPLSKDNFSIGLFTSYDAIYVPALETNSGLILPELAFYNLGNTTVLGSVGYVSVNFTNEYFCKDGGNSAGKISPSRYRPAILRKFSET